MQNNLHARVVTVFRHYTLKSYAVFRSIGREVNIGVLSVAMLSTQQVTAQTVQPVQQSHANAEREETMTEVTVNGTMTPLTEMRQARIVSVMTRDDIARAAASTVNDLLKSVSGVDVRQRGGFGIQTDISIDGGTFDQVTVLLNGINITNPQTGHFTMDLPVNLADIERIEILEGAVSRVYGASAFGGAINIVTRQPDIAKLNNLRNRPCIPDSANPPGSHENAASQQLECSLAEGEKNGRVVSEISQDISKDFAGSRNRNRRVCPMAYVSAHGGSWGTVGGEANVGVAARRTVHGLSGGIIRGDGGTRNSDFRRMNLYYRGMVNAGCASFDWQAAFSDKQYGANTFYSPKYPDQWESNRRWLVSMSADIRGRVHVHPSLYWNRLTDHFQLIRASPTGENHHYTDVFGGGVTADMMWTIGKTVLGANVRHEHIESTNLGKLKCDRQVAPSQEWHYDHADGRTQVDVTLEHNLQFDHWTVSAGVMASMNEAVNYRVRVYPGVDIAYRPNRQWRVYASYNKGFRIPTFTDLYYNGAERQGNGALQPEETHSVSLGARYGTNWVSAVTRVFYHRGRHMIDWVKYDAADQTYYAADFALDNLGAQCEADFDFMACCSVPLRVKLAYTHIHQWRHDARAVYKSSYAGEYLRNKFTASFAHTIYGPVSMLWSMRVCDRVGSYEVYEEYLSTGKLKSYSPYVVLDAKITCTVRHFTVWLRGENVTDNRYYDLGNIPQPGVCLLGGIRWML